MPRQKSVEEVFAEHLQQQGYRIERDLPHEPRVTLPVRAGATFRWAAVACTHLGGKFQQLTYLKQFCKFAVEERGVTDLWHIGDLVNGSSRRHDYIYENFIHGATAQCDYAAENLPAFKGVKWHFVEGNHDEWYEATEGFIVGEEMALRRPDMEYVGRRAAWLNIGPLSVYMHHGSGGMPYALTYKLQRAIERMNPRPDVYMIANWHSAVYAPGYAGCELLMAPCFQSTTPFERGKGLTPTIGGFILNIDIAEDNTWRVIPEFMLFKTPIEKDY